MKKEIILVCLCTLCVLAYPQTAYYYYYFDKKMPLSLDTSHIYIGTHQVADTGKLAAIIGPDYQVTASHKDRRHDIQDQGKYKNQLMTEVGIKSVLSEADYLSLIEKLKQIPEIDNVSPCFCTTKGYKADLCHMFNVQLRSADDIDKLKEMAQKTKTKVLSQDKYMPLWFSLSCDKNSVGNALEMANLFYESGKFASAEPDFFACVKVLGCSTETDPLFPQQWGLKNTGQLLPSGVSGTNGVDIGVCEAWNSTTGKPYIITAVVDMGYQLDHPDLAANNIGVGFDGSGGTSTIYGAHGTEVAGVIAAVQNNRIGISGVAPTSSIVSVSVDVGPAPVSEFTSAIEWAADPSEGNASIINMSWTIGNLPVGGLTTAISNAMTNGRGGLGCVMVAGAGNSIGDVAYPANLVVDATHRVLSVGAVDECGFQSGISPTVPPNWTISGPIPLGTNSCDFWSYDPFHNGSAVGSALDVVAPGTTITSTDWINDPMGSGGYISGLNGTSGSSAYASGVAALLLSLDPCLTQNDVINLIEGSCTKVDVSTMPYTNGVTGRPNGSWNGLHGYGLINAANAIQLLAPTLYLQHITESTSTPVIRSDFEDIVAGYDVTTSLPTGNYIISGGARVEIKSQTSITFKPGVKVTPASGGYMYGHITQFTTWDCNDWPGAKILEITPDNTSITPPVVEAPSANPISILPNPFSDNFQVKFSTVDNLTDISIEVYDLSGRQIYNNRESVLIGNHSYFIPVNSSASMFVIKVCVGNECQTQKMVQYESY